MKNPSPVQIMREQSAVVYSCKYYLRSAEETHDELDGIQTGYLTDISLQAMMTKRI
jgi:hypothetical protein